MGSYCACEWTTDGHLRDLCGAHMEAARRYALAERAECARIADEHLKRIPNWKPDKSLPDEVAEGYGNAANNIATEIRARRG
jgi:hypothetical protein